MDKLTHQNVAEYFSSINNVCPSCNANEWLITSMEHRIALAYLNSEMEFNLPPPMIPCVAVICVSCGYIRMHEENILKSAILSKKDHDE